MQGNQAGRTPFLRFSHLSGLQLFQLVRYSAFVIAGIGFAKLHLPPSEIGHYETFILLSGMVTYFWVSGIINSMLSVYPKLADRAQKQLFFNTFLTLIGMGIVAAALLLLFADNLLAFLHRQSEGNFIAWVVLYLLLNSPSFLIEYIFYLRQKKQALICYAAIFFLLTTSAILLPVAFGWDIRYSFFGLIGLAAVKIIALLFLIRRFGSFELNSALLWENFRLSLPLMFAILVSGSAEYIDGLIVKAKFDNVAFAVFRYGAKELPVILIVANTFSSAMIASVAENLDAGAAEIKKRSAKLMHLFFPLSTLLMLSSHFFYPLIFNDSFVYSALIFNIYLLLTIPRLLFPQTLLTGTQHTKWLLISSLFEITINVLLSLWLASVAGLSGIAAGTLVAYVFDKVFLSFVVYRRLGIAPAKYMPLSVFSRYTVLLAAAFALSLWIAANY